MREEFYNGRDCNKGKDIYHLRQMKYDNLDYAVYNNEQILSLYSLYKVKVSSTMRKGWQRASSLNTSSGVMADCGVSRGAAVLATMP